MAVSIRELKEMEFEAHLEECKQCRAAYIDPNAFCSVGSDLYHALCVEKVKEEDANRTH